MRHVIREDYPASSPLPTATASPRDRWWTSSGLEVAEVDGWGLLASNDATMKKITTTAAVVVLLFALGAQSSAWAGYDEGVAAAKRGDYATALREFRALALRGDAKGQNGLGVMYSKGQGVAQDDAEATKWFRKAAEQGFARAQFNLGNMYGIGQGVPQDYAEAARWWRKAAEQGDAVGQYNLGVMYSKGQGVPQDYVQAHMWLSLAASPGDDLAVKNLGTIVKRMTPAQVAEAQRLAREWMAKFEARSKKR